MFCRISVLFLAVAAGTCHGRNEAAAQKEGFMKSIAKKIETSSGNLRRQLQHHHHDHTNEAFDSCHLVSQHFGDDFVHGTSTGGCTCDGSLSDVLNLNCDFENVCDDIGFMCASVDVNVTLTNILDEDGHLGDDPKMSVASCVDTDMDFLEKMCLHMDFSKPDFFLPSACSFSYGDKECVCKIDKSAYCYDFDCSKVATSTEMARVLVSDSCKTVDLSGRNGVSMFLPALSDLKGEDSYVESGHGDENLTAMEVKFAAWAEKNGGN